MDGLEPKYLGVKGTNGDGWKILVWDDPQGELDRIQSRIDAGEVFTSVTVATSSSGSTQEVPRGLLPAPSSRANRDQGDAQPPAGRPVHLHARVGPVAPPTRDSAPG